MFTPALVCLFTLLFSSIFGAVGCDRTPVAPTPKSSFITVASLVPAATDLLVGMGATDHLIAVSNFEPPRPETSNLPKVGDYRTIDWEKIAELKPAVMITQFRPDKMPEGLEDRARHYGIRLVNVRINRLDDVFTVIAQLGTAVGEGAKASQLDRDLRAQLEAVRASVAGKPPVRTLISRTQNPLEVVGGGNVLDDLLKIAGGDNVLSGPNYAENSFPTLDRELLLSLNPDASLNLLPGSAPQVVATAKAFWTTMPSVSAAKSGHIYYLTDDYLLLAGARIGNIAARFAELLHPKAKANIANPVGGEARIGAVTPSTPQQYSRLPAERP